MSSVTNRNARLLRLVVGLAIIMTLTLTHHAHAFTPPHERLVNHQTNSTGHLIYAAKQGLMSVNLATGESTILSDVTYPEGVKVTPNGKLVIFAENGRLVAVPIDGGEKVDLAPSSTNYLLTPDSAFIISADYDPSDGYSDLFVTSIAGSEPRPLNTLPETTVVPQFFAISPDGKTVVFYAVNQRDRSTRLYAVPIDGGDPIALTEVISSDPSPIFFTANSQAAIWVGGLRDIQRNRTLYKLPLNGDVPIVLSPADSIVAEDSTIVTPKGDILFMTLGKLFRVAPSQNTSVLIGERVSSFHVSPSANIVITWGTNRMLNAVHLDTGTTTTLVQGETILYASISPDDAHVVYAISTRQAPMVLFSVPVIGGVSVQLTSPDLKARLVRNYSETLEEVERRWREDSFDIAGERVVFWGEDSAGIHLFSVPLTGGSAIKLNEVPGSVRFGKQAMYLVEGGKRIIFILDMGRIGIAEFYIVNVEGGQAQHLSKQGIYNELRANVVVYSPTSGADAQTTPSTASDNDDQTSTVAPTVTVAMIPPTDVALAPTATLAPATAIPTVAFSCPNSPPPRLTAGGWGRVTPGDANNLRNSPTGKVIGKVPGGMEFAVIEGPECGAGGRTYWRINFVGTMGWTAEGEGSTYWLEPIEARGS